MSSPEIIESLGYLASDLIAQGCHGGISVENEDKWLNAWAIAMVRVAAGTKYTDNLVIEIFNELYRGGASA